MSDESTESQGRSLSIRALEELASSALHAEHGVWTQPQRPYPGQTAYTVNGLRSHLETSCHQAYTRQLAKKARGEIERKGNSVYDEIDVSSFHRLKTKFSKYIFHEMKGQKVNTL